MWRVDAGRKMLRGPFRGRGGASGYAALARLVLLVLAAQLAMLATTTVLMLSAVLGLAASSVGMVSDVGIGGLPLFTDADISAVPQSVVDDASELATRLFGECGEERRCFLNDLLATYAVSQDKDVVVFANPGGWGNSHAIISSGWGSILNGIRSQLSDFNLSPLIVTYERSANSVQGHCGELVAAARGYSSKADLLASRIRFLTAHAPDLRVLIVGDSMGTLICREAMSILSDDERVFGIQIGPPWWYHQDDTSRTLVLTDNGVRPDSFSRCDLSAMISASLGQLLGTSQPGDEGTLLKYLRAPGHHYSWGYPGVSSQITEFLQETVGI